METPPQRSGDDDSDGVGSGDFELPTAMMTRTSKRAPAAPSTPSSESARVVTTAVAGMALSTPEHKRHVRPPQKKHHKDRTLPSPTTTVSVSQTSVARDSIMSKLGAPVKITATTMTTTTTISTKSGRTPTVAVGLSPKSNTKNHPFTPTTATTASGPGTKKGTVKTPLHNDQSTRLAASTPRKQRA